MPASKNLVGKTFGRLLVLEKTDMKYHGSIVWICLCECGKAVENTANALNSGHAKSCGCLKTDKNRERFSDKTGQRFGRLVALESTTMRSGTSIVWKCQCDCGNIVYVSANALESKKTVSCGCFHVDRIREVNLKDISGQRFGRLVAIKQTEKRDSTGCVIWECLCDCGKYSLVASRNLQSGTTKSCGCLNLELTVQRTIKRCTTHGKSKTKEYITMLHRRRKDRKKIQDIKWTFEMEIALKDFQKECVLCGSTKNLTVDHVLALSRGFGLKPGNAVMLCRSCNSKKNNKSLDQLPLPIANLLIEESLHFNTYWGQLNK